MQKEKQVNVKSVESRSKELRLIFMPDGFSFTDKNKNKHSSDVNNCGREVWFIELIGFEKNDWKSDN